MNFAGKIAQIKKAPAGRRVPLFESLVKETLTKKFERVEMWSEYAAEHAKHRVQEIGIDMVAYDSAGTKHAVQCQYRGEGTPPLRKQDIDRFLNACHAHKIKKMVLVYVGPDLKPNVREACREIEIYRRKRLAMLYNKQGSGAADRKWYFPPTGGVSACGFNQAGIEIFGGRQNQQRQSLPKQAIGSAVRELLQNSLDAKVPNTACRVTFEHDKIDRDTIAATDLDMHMKACEGQDDHPEFFRDARKTLRSAQIDVIRVTDSNTIGLDDEGWNVCTITEGRSAKKSDTAGGSYGLGKNASFPMSSIGVVCYATRLPHGAIMGNGDKTNARSIAKCRAISHRVSSTMLSHIGELKSYKQALARPGTSITMVGTRYITSKRSWQWEFEKAVKRNFFIAIADGELECYVADKRVKIDESTEQDELTRDKRQRRPPSYLEAVRMYGGGSKQTLQSEGLSFDVWIAASADDDGLYNNHCMYVNKRGMLITDEASTRRNPFHVSRQSHGSFLVLVRASDDATEKQMRTMEPPSHAEISISRSPEHASALRDVRKQIQSRIRDILFADSDQDDVTELSGLADILPIKRDSGDQTSLDAFVSKPEKSRGGAKVAVTASTVRTTKKTGEGGDYTPSEHNRGTTTPPKEGGEVRLDEIRMASGSLDSLRVYGTLLGGNGGNQSVNVVIRRVAESREYDEDGGHLPVREASAALVGDDGETAAKVDLLEGGRVLAVTTAPGTSGKRLRLDVTLEEPEPVRCAYEVGVVQVS